MFSASLPASASASLLPAPLFFSAKASELLEACKGLEAFRKGAQSASLYKSSGLDCGAAFLAFGGAAFTLEGFHQREAFYAWLPSSFGSGSFSLPFALLLSFVKATKGKGFITYESGKLSASASGTSLSVEAGPALESSEAAEAQKLFAEAYDLPALAQKQLSAEAEGFPLWPFLLAAPFASADFSKQVICGAGFSAESFWATDGFSLRRSPASLPAFPKSGAFPESAWLPAWLSSIVEAFAKPAERESLWAFFFQPKQSYSALRFSAPSGLIVALRFSSDRGSFPNCAQLFPESLPFSFSIDREAFLHTVEGLCQALKSSEGAPLLDLSFDPESGSLGFSALLQKNKGSKQRPELEEVGKQEASCFARFESFPEDPSFESGFSELPEDQRLMAKAKLEDQKRLCINGLFLLKAIKSFAKEGSRLSFQWKDSRAPFVLSAASAASACLIMPVQKRR
jgi:hypothetical protein